ncbi:nicotinamide riboside kinase 1 [Poronia punctata]|nr:nicotinamide riboside kinase 1 [Poronia punctata]
MAENNRKAVIVGISGASSSGKTTLARLLRDVFPNTFVLHEDDFYRAEEEIPIKDGILDWDCQGAINFDEMAKALEYIRAEGEFPPFVDSKEDKNSVGKNTVPETVIQAAKARVAEWSRRQPAHSLLTKRLCILDGFLLFGRDRPLSHIADNLLDIRILLTVSRARATARREARDGYVTLEGFWKDPPGYVDKIVWPNYAASHAWLFKEGNVEGKLDGGVLREKDILALPGLVDGEGGEDGQEQGLDVDMRVMFEWAVEMLIQKLEEVTKTG